VFKKINGGVDSFVTKKAQMHFLNFMFHMVVQRGFKRWREVLYFVNNLLLFPTVKEFSKSVNI